MDNRDKGYTLFKKGLKYKEIAEKLGVSESTVRSWAARYWKKEKAAACATKNVAKNATSDATKKRKKPSGAPHGNVNAVGNNGGAPARNQNAFKHGGYSAILFDTLDAEEHDLIAGMDPNEEQLLIDEINLLTVRERRIMKRIEDAKSGPKISGVTHVEHKRSFRTEEEAELYYQRMQDMVQSGELLPGNEYSEQTISEASYSIILKLEEALTRCQAQKQRAIDSLCKVRQAQGSKGGALADDWISGVMQTAEEL